MSFLSTQERELFTRLRQNQEQQQKTNFNEWCYYYQEALESLHNLAQQQGSDIPYIDLCRWVYQNTEAPLRDLKQMKRENNNVLLKQ